MLAQMHLNDRHELTSSAANYGMLIIRTRQMAEETISRLLLWLPIKFFLNTLLRPLEWQDQETEGD